MLIPCAPLTILTGRHTVHSRGDAVPHLLTPTGQYMQRSRTMKCKHLLEGITMINSLGQQRIYNHNSKKKKADMVRNLVTLL